MFNKMRRLAIVSMALVLAACGGSDDDDHPPMPGTVLQVAAGDARFSLLAEAVTKAELGAALSAPGPITVFAPTNAAFDEIPEDQLQAILADKDKLTKILTYHVLEGKVLSKNLKKKQTVETVEGSPVTIRAKKSGVTVGDAKVVKADIKTSNGVIHVIDTVLLPK